MVIDPYLTDLLGIDYPRSTTRAERGKKRGRDVDRGLVGGHKVMADVEKSMLETIQ